MQRAWRDLGQHREPPDHRWPESQDRRNSYTCFKALLKCPKSFPKADDTASEKWASEDLSDMAQEASARAGLAGLRGAAPSCSALRAGHPSCTRRIGSWRAAGPCHRRCEWGFAAGCGQGLALRGAEAHGRQGEKLGWDAECGAGTVSWPRPHLEIRGDFQHRQLLGLEAGRCLSELRRAFLVGGEGGGLMAPGDLGAGWGPVPWEGPSVGGGGVGGRV